MLVGSGCNEIMVFFLSELCYYKEMLIYVLVEELVYVNNIFNVYLDIMRLMMLVSGLEVILYN